MRVLIPLAVFIVGCVSLTVGAFLLSPAAGFITAGILMVAGSFTWGYVETGTPKQPGWDELRDRRAAA